MCGIVGGISERNVVPIIIEGLARLEYRGYDSVGIAIINKNNQLQRIRTIKRVESLKEEVIDNIFGYIGIGHTRWATHGGVTTNNAHPHFSLNKIAVVHNGIIENYAELKIILQNKGYTFDSETDTEVIAHLIYDFYQKTNNILIAVRDAINMLLGSYAIGVICNDEPDTIICVANGAPLLLGLGINELYFSSDVSALLSITNKIIYFEDKDILKIQKKSYCFYDYLLNPVKRDVITSNLSIMNFELGKFRHYMQKEIFEQPNAIASTLQYLGNDFNMSILDNSFINMLGNINRVQIIACGTSYNAGSVAKYWFEDICNLPCQVDIASEYRYRNIQVSKDELIISISQSGETADTLACIKHLHQLGLENILTICNVAESSLVRLSKFALLTQAGIEVGVASTKAFSTQLLILLYLCYTIKNIKNKIDKNEILTTIKYLRNIPQYINNILMMEQAIINIANELKYHDKALFIGRNTMYPIACEGSLKIKELSYIYAESYPAGELKHGPLALVDKNLPVFVLMSKYCLYDKVKSNIEEILARDGLVYLITDMEEDEIFIKCHKVIKLPYLYIDSKHDEVIIKYINPILFTIPLQLLAYYTATTKGTDVDKPRNLAKSVTVE
jgi:glucosamine--fructose-6-phosphate aminotransferase (isomerizing)